MATPTRSSRRSPARRAASPGKRAEAAQPRRGKPRPRPSEAVVLDPRLAEGVALYNHHRFFECHEVLEQLWLRTEGRPRDFYKGLIQAAVAFHHWSRGNPAGAMSLYRSSSRYLKKYLPVFLGVDVQDFLRRYAELFRWLRRHPQRYDRHLLPEIRYGKDRDVA